MVPLTKPAARAGQRRGASTEGGGASGWKAVVLLLAVCEGCFAGNLLADEPAAEAARDGVARDGLFITVPNPIDDKAVSQIERKVQEAIERQGRHITTVVFDFNPQGLPSGTSDWNSPNRLAELIRHLQQATVPGKNYPHIATIAFIQNLVTRQTVLPVLACKQIIMSDEIDPRTRQIKARLGDVQRDLAGSLGETARLAYAGVARNYASPDLVQRMLDRNLVLKQVKTTLGTRYLTEKSMKELDNNMQPYTVDDNLPDALQVGNAVFDAQQAFALGLCSGIKNSSAELAAALHLPRKSLTEDWLVVHERVYPWRIEVRGPLDKGKLEAVERRLKKAVGQGANFIILQLDAEAGETKYVAATAQLVRGLRDDHQLPVKTVAYVPPGRSLGAATFLAVACNEIVMAKDAVVTDFSYLPADQLPDVKAMLLPLVKDQGYPALLFEATLDKDLVLYRVRTKEGEDLLVTERDLKNPGNRANPRNADAWHKVSRVDRAPGSLLRITAPLALEFRIAQSTDIASLDDLNAHYGLEPQKIRVARDDWLESVAEFFREPAVNFLLIMLGIVGLIMELKMPGTTVPGVVAAICFVLFFWAYSFVGQFTLLAVLLFVLGLILIGLEIFVLPGFGFTGISGIVLLISSLVLVTLERMPQTSQDWVSLGATFGTFGLSLVAALAAAFLLAWFLPSIPYANRLVLQPPGDAALADDAGGHSALSPALLGAIGVAATPLRPAGKAQIGDDFLDVIAEGDYVQPGSRVQVIEIEGNRIVVKEIG
jgi:membrane-bound serine protease (ClpP class)